MRSLTELSLNITEEEYRELSQLSYSTLAKYEKGGFSSIPKLFEETPTTDALIFGSAVDTIITQGREVFEDKFYVADLILPADAVILIIKYLLSEREEQTLEEITDDIIIDKCNEYGYCTKMSDAIRVARIREGATYYNIVKASRNKTVIATKMYYEIMRVVNCLLDGAMSKYLQPKSEGKAIEFLYQQKFITNLDGLEVKMMADLLIVNHEKKMIIPIDLKTTGMPEYYFPHKYLDNRYDIQAKLYWHILRDVLDKDAYFKDFTLLDFRFIVINKNSLTPLMFVDKECSCSNDTTITFKSGKILTLRNPITIGKELKYYLDTAATLPNGFTQNEPVDIYKMLINE